MNKQNNEKQSVLPEGWPRPAGYANAVSGTGRLVLVSGQVGWNPLTSRFPAGASFADEVRQALINVVSALAAAGARPEQIARMTWYVTDRDAYMDARKAIGKTWREIIGRHYPAMSVVIVAGVVERPVKGRALHAVGRAGVAVVEVSGREVAAGQSDGALPVELDGERAMVVVDRGDDAVVGDAT